MLSSHEFTAKSDIPLLPRQGSRIALAFFGLSASQALYDTQTRSKSYRTTHLGHSDPNLLADANQLPTFGITIRKVGD
jgi:hypothetical protein